MKINWEQAIIKFFLMLLAWQVSQLTFILRDYNTKPHVCSKAVIFSEDNYIGSFAPGTHQVKDFAPNQISRDFLCENATYWEPHTFYEKGDIRKYSPNGDIIFVYSCKDFIYPNTFDVSDWRVLNICDY